MPWFDFHPVVFCADLGKVEEGVFDPSTLDPERCESCYGAETEDLKWVSLPQTERLWFYERTGLSTGVKLVLNTLVTILVVDWHFKIVKIVKIAAQVHNHLAEWGRDGW